MYWKSIVILSLSAFFITLCGFFLISKGEINKNELKIEFISYELEKKIDVLVEGNLFTSYRWHDPVGLDIKKPILYPIMTSTGTEITRGFPLNPRPGERVDHPHQVGLCFNYGHVNGYDFWNNSTAIPENKREGYGVIKHQGIDELSIGTSGQGLLVTSESWIDPWGKELLAEKTEYHFIAEGSTRIIDRVTTLTATDMAVSMRDTKEGGFGIRVARQLELPSQDELVLVDTQGNPTTVRKMSNKEVSGNYRSSEGIIGEAVYGTRGKWVNLYGNIGDEKVSVVMVDHPQNPGYPTYWHARGYGLLLANPFGASDYSNGEDVMNFSIPTGKSATLRFRLVINSGVDLTDAEINIYAADFARKY